MNIDWSRASLVLAGQWNPAIVTPQWIGRNVLRKAEAEQFDVIVEMAIPPVAPPRFRFQGLDMTAGRDKLVFRLAADEGSRALSLRTAQQVLALLPHTPVGAFGFNLVFKTPRRSARLLARFNNADISTMVDWENAALRRQSLKVHLDMDGYTHITTVSLLEDGSVEVAINTEFKVANCERAAALLDDHTLFAKVYREALGIASGLTEEDLEEEINAAVH